MALCFLQVLREPVVQYLAGSEQRIAPFWNIITWYPTPRYADLISFLRSRLTQVEKRWTEWRKKHEVEKAKEMSPALGEWIESLPPGFQKSAETLIANLSALPVEHEEDKKLMYKHGILAFERMKLRGSAEEFVNNVSDIETLLSVLADRDVLEASLYRDIVKSRLDAIKDFQGLLDEDAQEKVLQKYLFDHPLPAMESEAKAGRPQ